MEKLSHIHGGGKVESHDTTMQRLMARFGLDEADLFHSPAERLKEALRRQEQRIAYVNEDFRVDEVLGR